MTVLLKIFANILSILLYLCVILIKEQNDWFMKTKSIILLLACLFAIGVSADNKET